MRPTDGDGDRDRDELRFEACDDFWVSDFSLLKPVTYLHGLLRVGGQTVAPASISFTHKNFSSKTLHNVKTDNSNPLKEKTQSLLGQRCEYQSKRSRSRAALSGEQATVSEAASAK
ncbi:hypothetical protein ACLOJK_037901 [Asimina triloba]